MSDVNFLSDKPGENPDQDELNRAPFAKHLAHSLLKMSPADGFVVAIYGPWGSGKTTLLEYVIKYLNQVPKEEKPVIAVFNPWWFSGREALVRHFFDQLQARLDKKDSTVKKLRKGIGKLSNAVSKVPGAEIVGILGEVVDPKDHDVIELKEQVSKLLRHLKHRIVIIIDDIDRLPADEVGEIFRIIKVVADLPNVIYILAFDKQRTNAAIEQSLSLPGDDYLEKIVQLPFDLPLPDKNLLKHILSKRLNDIFEDFPSEVFNPPYWGDIPWSSSFAELARALDHFIQTPRDIARLTNVLKATFPAVKGEVHVVDFVGVEVLRLFSPQLYDIVRRNSSQFTGATHGIGFDNTDKVLFESWLGGIDDDDRQAAIDLLRICSPG